jgi:hypothetical protein
MFASVRFKIVTLLLSYFAGWEIHAGDNYELAPIAYYASSSTDTVARLITKFETGDVALSPDKDGNYLKSLLQALNVPEASQCLVFSKTSLQVHQIGPRNPRAIYFNDTVYVGYVPGSKIIELAAIDPQLGCVFYTFESDQEAALTDEDEEAEPIEIDHSAFIRDKGQCLSCHATSRTENVPGVLVRSIYPDRSGRARSGSSSYVTDHRSPLTQRWGGWYVTGHHGSMRHLGNSFATDRQEPQLIDKDSQATLSALPLQVNVTAYLQPTSDIVALMVLEHQTRIHNLITSPQSSVR